MLTLKTKNSMPGIFVLLYFQYKCEVDLHAGIASGGIFIAGLS